MLEELGACIDHVEPYNKQGAHDLTNFAVACARCNARKSNRRKSDCLAENPPWNLKSKYGEPKHWDGMSSLFVAFARQAPGRLTDTERAWLKALEGRFATRLS